MTTLSLALLMACMSTGAEEGGGARPAAPVEVAEVRSGSLDDEQVFLGEVRALERAELAAGAAGAVRSVSVREGDRAKRGALLLEVDPALAAARVRTADAAAEEGAAQLDEARAAVTRLRQVASGVVAPHEMEQAEARYRAVEARHAGLLGAADEKRAELARHRVRAPFDGVVASRLVDPGDWVQPGQPVLGLVSVDAVEIRVPVPSAVVRAVAEGDEARVLSPPTVGRVAGVVPALDPGTRTATIRIAPEPGSLLVPGSGVEVALSVDAGAGVIVPRDAIVASPLGSKVVRVVEGAADIVDVEVLSANGAEILVRAEGLAPGDVVVVRGNERLRPGQPVAVGGT